MNELTLKAVGILRAGGLVAIPTETVYGLAADATNATAVERIFRVKGRPGTNPLIVHVADANVARRYARDWPDSAQKLAERFWPGPITLVVQKSQVIVPQVTAGLDTVGLRAPDHPLTLELLRAFDAPVAAPSANRSNRISPTTADHVRQELGDAVGLVLDGGPCRVGIESTVLYLTRHPPVILRPGTITGDQIASVIGPVESASTTVTPDRAVRSPGQQPVHYAPSTPAYRFDSQDSQRVVEWTRTHPERRAAFLVRDQSTMSFAIGRDTTPVIISLPSTAAEYARELYSQLRHADSLGLDVLFVEMPPEHPEWAAARDRVRRATRELSGL